MTALDAKAELDRGRSHRVGRANVGTGRRAHGWAELLAYEVQRRGGLEVWFDEPLEPYQVQLVQTFGATPRWAGQVHTILERVKVDKSLGKALSAHCDLKDDGWDVAAALSPDEATVVLMACKLEPDR